MNKSILITGIPGTGKSAVSDELKKCGYKTYNIEDIKGLFTMVDKKTGKTVRHYNEEDLESVKQRDWVFNKKKLQQLIRKNSKGIVFYCGTASNLDDLLSLFDKIFLLKASKKTLSRRLSARTPDKCGCAPEVQKWIFSWKKWYEDHVCKKGAIVIDANQSLQKVTEDVIKTI